MGLKKSIFGIKRPFLHKNNYRIHHPYIQKHIEKYDNDTLDIWIYDEDDDCKLMSMMDDNENGISKEVYKFHDPEAYDDYKDAENQTSMIYEE